MLMALLFTLHILAALVWVGGMFFAHMALRPTAAAVLQPPERLTLLAGVFARFFLWVKVSIVLLFLSGFWMIHIYGNFAKAGWHVHLMLLLAVVMTVIFGVIYAGPYKSLRYAVGLQQWPAAGKAMTLIRQLVGINLILGLITVCVGMSGRFLAF